MGRNGKSKANFRIMAEYISAHVGDVVYMSDIISDCRPGAIRPLNMKSLSMYMYWFAQLGYIEIANNRFLKDPEAKFRIVKKTPEFFTASAAVHELRQRRGYII